MDLREQVRAFRTKPNTATYSLEDVFIARTGRRLEEKPSA